MLRLPWPRPGRLRVALVALVVVALLVAAGGAGLLGVGPLAGLAGGARTPDPSGTVVAGAATPSPSASPTATSTPSPSPSPSPTPTPIPQVVLAPVTNYRSAVNATDVTEVRGILAGDAGRYSALELVSGEATTILAAAKLWPPADSGRLVLAADVAALRADLAAHPDRLGIIRADAVDPSVRALAWGDVSLFGVGRVRSLADWPLKAPLADAAGQPVQPGTTAFSGYDPAAAWTIFAAGDILLDRGVYLTTRINGKGADYPFDGGSAAITSRYCCSSFGWKLPTTKRTGDAGAMRALISEADLALANFENPAPVKFTYHKSGTVFSADPSLIEGLKDAGIDWVSLANNHIGDAGATGIVQTISALDGWGIAHAGAGKGASQVHAAAILSAGGVKVGVLGYDTIAPSYWQTTAGGTGSARMTEAALRQDIAAARAAGAQIVIVYPHWGVEYTTKVSSAQSRLGHAAIDAGADMVIGNHPHWAGALEIYKGKPIWYALGNFVFDQTWSEPTMEGITLELTFSGTSLVQAVMHPHLILDRSQSNLMDPAGSGAVVMKQVFDGSKGLLPW